LLNPIIVSNHSKSCRW